MNLLFFSTFSLLLLVLFPNVTFAGSFNCKALIQYFARIGKPLNKESMVTLDKSICQRFEKVIRKRGVSAVDRKLRALLIFRQMRIRYQMCMERYHFIQYCHRFVINGNLIDV